MRCCRNTGALKRLPRCSNRGTAIDSLLPEACQELWTCPHELGVTKLELLHWLLLRQRWGAWSAPFGIVSRAPQLIFVSPLKTAMILLLPLHRACLGYRLRSEATKPQPLVLIEQRGAAGGARAPRAAWHEQHGQHSDPVIECLITHPSHHPPNSSISSRRKALHQIMLITGTGRGRGRGRGRLSYSPFVEAFGSLSLGSSRGGRGGGSGGYESSFQRHNVNRLPELDYFCRKVNQEEDPPHWDLPYTKAGAAGALPDSFATVGAYLDAMQSMAAIEFQVTAVAGMDFAFMMPLLQSASGAKVACTLMTLPLTHTTCASTLPPPGRHQVGSGAGRSGGAAYRHQWLPHFPVAEDSEWRKQRHLRWHLDLCRLGQPGL